MVAKATEGLIIGLTKGSAVAGSITATAISYASPAHVTAVNVVELGNLVYCIETGFEELDGWWWLAYVQSPTGFALYGSDTTDSEGVFDTGSMIFYDDSQQVFLCLSSLSINIDDPGELDLSTYCTPNAAIPATPKRGGTLTLAGYVDIDSEEYDELVKAETDQQERIMTIQLPENGYLIAPLRISTMSWDLPLDGAVAYTARAVLSAKMRHLYP